MKKQKIISIGYTERSFFHHPQTKEEFESLMIDFRNAYKCKDLKGMTLIALQLFPDKIICKE